MRAVHVLKEMEQTHTVDGVHVCMHIHHSYSIHITHRVYTNSTHSTYIQSIHGIKQIKYVCTVYTAHMYTQGYTEYIHGTQRIHTYTHVRISQLHTRILQTFSTCSVNFL